MKAPARSCAVLLLTTWLVHSPNALAGPGGADNSFGTGGKVTVSEGSFDGNDDVMLVQRDGGIITVGTTDHGTEGGPTGLVLRRHQSNGTPDGSFAFTNTAVTTNVYAVAAALQLDGKIVVTGSQDAGANGRDLALLRFNANGTLDTSFGTSGKVLTHVSSGDEGVGVTLQWDDRIVVTGTNGSDLLLVRYLPNGSLDTSFDIDGNQDGIVVTNFGGGETGNKVAVLGDGRILVAGDMESTGGGGVIVARYLSNGRLDTSFDSDGKVVTTSVGGQNGCAWGMALQSDGKIIVGGRTVDYDSINNVPLNTEFLLLRYMDTGALDTSFGGGDGIVTTVASSQGSEGNGFALQSNGKILLAGAVRGASGVSSFAVARYLTDGTLDTSFGTDGVATTDMNGSDDAVLSTVVVLKDGSILAGGIFDTAAGMNQDYDFALVRYQGDARPNIVGTWTLAYGAEHNGTMVVTFLGNGEYFLVEDGDSAADPSGQDGMEHGRYTWNADTGAFTALSDTDTNGAWGLSPADVVMTVTPATITGSDFLFNRVSHASNSLVGSWMLHSPNGNFSNAVLTFLANGTYFLAEDGDSILDPSGQDGMERGTYTWDAITGALTVTTTVDTNGEWGLFNVAGALSAVLTGSDLALTSATEGTLVLNGVLSVREGPLAGSEDFADNVKDTNRWFSQDNTNAGGTLVEANGRLEYRVATPNADYDEALRPWGLNYAGNSDAFDVILDVHNQVPANDPSNRNASIGITVTSLENRQDSIYVELARGSADGTGFLSALRSHEFGGDEVTPYTVPTNHPAVTDGSVRLSYNPTTKLFTAWYDATGSGDGYQWTAYGTFGVGASGGGSMRNSAWLLTQNRGFEVSISSFSEGLTTASGSVYADNFSLSTTGISTQATLASLAPSAGTLTPSFSPGATTYTLTVPNTTATLMLTPMLSQANASVKVRDVSVVSAAASSSIPLVPGGVTTISVVGTAQDHVTSTVYRVDVTRQTAFQTWATGQGLSGADAGSTVDYDHDGLVNLVEYAFGLNPTLGNSFLLPQGQRVGGNYGFSFNTPAGVSGVTYGAEWSTTLLPGSWTPISNTGTLPQNAFFVPVGSNTRLFVRLIVTGQ
jgi:uncharacterized delta-60 repeat protein